MGYFVEIQPGDPGADLASKYPAATKGRRRPSRCEGTDAAGNRCDHLTALPPAHGKIWCYFHHPEHARIVGRNPVFDAMMQRIATNPTRHDERAAISYRPNLEHIASCQSKIDTLVEIGAYQGGFSAVLAQAAVRFGMMYYIVDPRLEHLLYAYERIAALFPDCLDRVRFYHGEFFRFAEQHEKALCRRSVYLEVDPARHFQRIAGDLAGAHRICDGIHSIGLNEFRCGHGESGKWDYTTSVKMVFGANARIRRLGGDGYLIDLTENGFCFDNLAARPPLRQIISTSIRRSVGWFALRIGERRRRKNLDPIYEPALATGVRLLDAVGREVEVVFVDPGESIDLKSVGRTFVEYDGGLGLREAPAASLEAASRDAEIAEASDGRVTGKTPGLTRLRFGRNGMEFSVSAAVGSKAWVNKSGVQTGLIEPCYTRELAAGLPIDPVKRNQERLGEHIRNRDTVLESGPCKVELSVTSYCNLHCRMCPGAPRDKKLERSYDQILDEMGVLLDGVEEIGLTANGEPLIWKDYERAAADLSRRGKVLRLVTNATLADRHMESFAKDNYLSVCISCDGTGNVYEGVRRGAKWEAVSRNIRMLSEVLRGRDPKPLLTLNMTVGTYNYRDIANVVAFAEDAGVDSVGLSRLSLWRKDLTAQDDILRANKQEEAAEMLRNLRGRTRVEVVCWWDQSLTIKPDNGEPYRYYPEPTFWKAADWNDVQCIYPFLGATFWLSAPKWSPCCAYPRDGSIQVTDNLHHYWNCRSSRLLRKKSYEGTLIPGPCGKDICYIAHPLMTRLPDEKGGGRIERM